MIQLSLFAPTPCPCGCGPYVHQEGEDWVIGLWCVCPEVMEIKAPTYPEAADLWEGYLAGRVAA